MRVSGKVYLVGAGPGDPKLITLKALEAIQSADVIIYDRLVSPVLFMYMKDSAERVYAGKKKDHHILTQDEINQLLVDYALQGKTVTRLKGGDPTIYGRGAEEAEVLAEHGIEYEIIPGISSIYAVPAYAGIPVTHRDYASSFCVVTGHEKPDKLATSIRWDRLSEAADTLVFLMGMSRIDFICEQLIRHGRAPDMPVAVIRWGTRVEQRTLLGTLADIAEKAREANMLPPALIIVGEVVRLRERISWFEKRPLFGKRVLVTRSRAQAGEMIRGIEELGGEAVPLPVMRIEPVRDEKRLMKLDQALADIERYDWLVFTSVNGVEYFFRRLRERRIDVRRLVDAKIICVGPKTAEAVMDRGLIPDELPESYQAEGLAELLLSKLTPGERVLIPRSAIARDVLPEALSSAGYEVQAVDVYDNLSAGAQADWVADMLSSGDLTDITFTSSSAVHYLVEMLQGSGIEQPEQLINRCRVICIGPIAEATAKQYGIQVTAVSREATIASMLETLRSL